MVDYPNKVQSHSRVTKRLSDPLLGLSCILTTRKLTILQLSNAGDLFYQNVFRRESKLTEMRDEWGVKHFKDFELDFTACGGCGSKKPSLTRDDKEFLAKWVECLMEQTDEEDMSGDNCGVENVSAIRKEIFSSLETDVSCSLCSENRLGNSSGSIGETGENCTSSKTDATVESRICPYCNLTRESSDQLCKARTSDWTILTKDYLGLSYEVESLHMFDEDIQCSEPLGKVLLRNWHSDEQVPIELAVEHEPEEINKNELVEKYLEMNRESTESPVRNQDENIQTPTRKTAREEIQSPIGDRRKIKTQLIKSPKTPKTQRSPDPGQNSQVISKRNFKNLCTPDSAVSVKGGTSQDKTPNLTNTPHRNPMNSPLETSRNQSRTPTKKKITRVAGF